MGGANYAGCGFAFGIGKNDVVSLHQIDAAAEVANHGWKKGQKISRSIEEFSTQIGDQVEVQLPRLDYQSSPTAEKKEDLCVILFCWFGIALKAMEAATASFANA